MTNLKMISDLLRVSVDYLLDNNATAVKYIIREPIHIKDYGKGIKKKKADRAIRAKFPDAEIRTLIPTPKLTKTEKIVDTILGWLTPAGFGIPQMLDTFKLAGEYYLVIKGERQYIVIVADDYIETQELAFKVTDNNFEFGNFVFTIASYKNK